MAEQWLSNGLALGGQAARRRTTPPSGHPSTEGNCARREDRRQTSDGRFQTREGQTVTREHTVLPYTGELRTERGICPFTVLVVGAISNRPRPPYMAALRGELRTSPK